MKTQKFSLPIYLLIVFAFSWPFQIAYGFLGAPWRPLLLVSMIMAGVGTFVAGKYIFRDGFGQAGWKAGKPRYYWWTLLLVLLIWFVPTLIEELFDLHQGYGQVRVGTILTEFVLSFAITLLPAFGEEFSWRGYLLPRLLDRFAFRKAVLLQGIVTWVWHLPVLIVMGLTLGENPVVGTVSLLMISFIPTILHAVIFAFIWSRSGSIWVATFYHAAFDEVRDSLQQTVGFGPLVEIWQMGVVIMFGLMWLWKKEWWRGTKD